MSQRELEVGSRSEGENVLDGLLDLLDVRTAEHKDLLNPSAG